MPVAGFFVILSLYVAFKAAFGILICDDAYITLGHARSLVSGLGAVMSERNPVSATSTPLFTCLLALESLAFRTQNFERLAYLTNVAADLLGLFFLHRIAARGLGLPAPWALGAAGAYALSVNFLAVSAYGMETPLYTALGLAGVWLRLFSPLPFARAMPALFPILMAAACIRPEGGLLAAALLAAGWFKDAGEGLPLATRMKRAFWVASAAGLGLLLFLLFYHLAYGHWLPHSVVAKRLEIRVGWGEALWSWIANVFFKGPTLGGASVTTAANLLILAAAAAGFLRKGAGPFPWTLLLWPALYILFFLATRSSYILFTWYYLPVLPFLILACAAGLARLAAGRVEGRAAYGLLALFLAWVSAQTWLQDMPAKHRLLKAAREDRYEAAAALVNAEAGRAPTVMIDEVGALAYFCKARILDTHGLLSPEALPFLGPAEGYWDRLADLGEKEKPDWIMGLREVHMEGKFHPGEDRLYRGYVQAHVLRLPPHGWNMEMWRRPETKDSTRFAFLFPAPPKAQVSQKTQGFPGTAKPGARSLIPPG